MLLGHGAIDVGTYHLTNIQVGRVSHGSVDFQLIDGSLLRCRSPVEKQYGRRSSFLSTEVERNVVRVLDCTVHLLHGLMNGDFDEVYEQKMAA